MIEVDKVASLELTSVDLKCLTPTFSDTPVLYRNCQAHKAVNTGCYRRNSHQR